MSVRKGDRGEGNLQVLNLARILAKHTIDKCRSEKTFPKNQRWTLCKPIMDECLGVLTCIRRANAVYVGDDPVAWRYRRSQQIQAHSHIDALLTLLDVAYTAFNIKDEPIAYWVKLCCDTDDKLKAWMKGDKERYGHLSKESPSG